MTDTCEEFLAPSTELAPTAIELASDQRDYWYQLARRVGQECNALRESLRCSQKATDAFRKSLADDRAGNHAESVRALQAQVVTLEKELNDARVILQRLVPP